MSDRRAGDAGRGPAGGDGPEPDTRSARKRRVIMEAATSAFLRSGYLGTSMDEIAALAAVSKQTVYKHFADKERLFTDIILATSDRVIGELVETATRSLPDTDDVEKDLAEVGRRLITAICDPQVLRLRRLVIGEAGRFPELGRTYWERGFERGLATLATTLSRLAERGRLRLDDPLLAAQQFAGMLLWVPVHRVLFCGEDAALPAAEVERYAAAGAHAFLAAYGRQ
jgi:TetR/AcrR family transcriptional regulator, mexJK operon transcriptional repressor